MAQLSNNPWLGVSSGAEALARDPRMTGQPDAGPMDLGVSGNAGYQVAHGGVLGRIGEFLGRLGVNQDYEDGVMRDSSGGRLYPNPYGEGNVHENLYNNELWHQDQMRKLRPQ